MAEAEEFQMPEECSFSKSNCTSFRHGWVVEKFSLCMKSDQEKLTSKIFSSGLIDLQDRWRLELYPNREQNVYVYLILVSLSEASSIDMKWRIFFLDSVNENARRGSSVWRKNITKDRVLENVCYEYTSRSKLFDSKEKYLPDDKLTIIVQIDIIKTFTLDLSGLCLVPPKQLSSDLAGASQNQKFGDVTFIIGEKKLKAYKGILAARSPVFAGMFEHETMEENKTNEVIIPDIEEKVFEEFLHFIYSDEAPNLSRMPMELLAVAEKYQVKRLKALCEKELGDTITIENGAQMFAFADLHNALQLMNMLIEYFKNQFQEFLVSEGSIALEKTNPPLALKILKLLLRNDAKVE